MRALPIFPQDFRFCWRCVFAWSKTIPNRTYDMGCVHAPSAALSATWLSATPTPTTTCTRAYPRAPYPSWRPETGAGAAAHTSSYFRL